MKNITALLILLVAVSCIPGGNSKESKEAKARSEKIGKLSLNKAEIDKYKFEINGVELTESKIPYGCLIAFKIKGLEGFKETKGKVMLDASVTGYNSKNEEIFALKDLFAEEFPNGCPVEAFSDFLRLTLRCQTPMKMNETYKIVFTVKDKASEAKVEVAENFTMIPTPGLVYEEKGIVSDGPFLLNSKDVNNALSDNKISAGDTISVYFTTIEGLTEKDGLVSPNGSVKFCNEYGDVITEVKDIYKSYGEKGVEALLVKQQISMRLFLPSDLKSGKKYSATFSLADKNDKAKELSAKYDFTIK